ncbi:ParB N-terminal domain-containing protein [Thauera chlorobenzoica]|nr:ParB N-terminal domain-containing protein [Thauera chlorobenzoica]SEG30437.1 Chromosome segregation protein Spo0J, contains ParB-like nuclease domain [Thauera chlorobenzoica]
MKTQHDIIEHIDPEALTPHPDNSMKHGDGQITQLVASFEQFGFNGVIVVDEGNVVLAGHGRRLAAIRAGMKTVPCLRRTGLSEAQKRAYIIADNQIARNGEWDETVLAQQLALLKDDGFDLGTLGIGADALASLSNLSAATAKLGEGAEVDKAPPAAPVVKRRRGVEAVEEVINERERQIAVEGWAPAHDDKYQDGELPRAAACYALHGCAPQQDDGPSQWPFPAEWWKPGTPRRNLVKAAALLIAEIERLDRAEKRRAVIAEAAAKAAAKAAEKLDRAASKGGR